MKRTATIIAIFILLTLIGISFAQILYPAIFILGLFLQFIPNLILRALTLITAFLAITAFRQNKLVLVAFFVLLISQLLILFSWSQGWTAASAFQFRPSKIGLPVIDPNIERKLMIVFVLTAAGVFALIIEHLLSSVFISKPRSLKNLNISRTCILLLEIFLFVSLFSSIVIYRQMFVVRNIPPSVSPSGSKEIKLVPMNCWIDVNGIVITRTPKSIFWKTTGQVGDILSEAESGRFVWSNDESRVYLLLNLDGKEFPAFGFDFKANEQIDSQTYFNQE